MSGQVCLSTSHTKEGNVPQFRIVRKGLTDLVFNGQKLADETSDDTGKLRWAEIRIYRTDSGKYVVEQLGMSRVPGDITKIDVRIVDTAPEVVEALRRKKKTSTGPVITHIALDALDAAGALDPAIADASVEQI